MHKLRAAIWQRDDLYALKDMIEPDEEKKLMEVNSQKTNRLMRFSESTKPNMAPINKLK